MATKEKDKTEIPEGWEEVSLGEDIEVFGGFAFSSKDFKKQSENTIPIIKIGDLKNGKIIFNERTSYVNKKFYEELRDYRIFKGDVLIALSGATTGKISIVQKIGNALLNQRVGKFKIKDLEKLNSRFFSFVSQNKPFQNQIFRNIGQSAQGNLSPKTIERIKILKPKDPKEQEAIAKVLSDVDKAIDKVQDAIDKTQKIKKGLMNYFYREKLDEKNLVKLNTLFKVESGGTPSTKVKEYWKNPEVNWITPADLGKLNGEINLSSSERKISKKALEDKNLTIMPKETIILSTRAPVGNLVVIQDESTFNQGCHGLLPLEGKELNPYYYAYYLITKKYILQTRSGQSTFKELSKTMLEKFETPEIDKKEQDKIAEILLTVDKKLSLEKQKKKKLERIKQGLMNDLLTGKKRVDVKKILGER